MLVPQLGRVSVAATLTAHEEAGQGLQDSLYRGLTHVPKMKGTRGDVETGQSDITKTKGADGMAEGG